MRTQKNQLVAVLSTAPQLTDFIARIGELGGTRTRDPLIKSQMLYRLSYELWGVFAVAAGP
jgi:hypothetical protein